ncbi:MAG: type II toxin-antitoxin system PemK/MazF family toxin [Acidimicrobiia bacterium]
MRSGLSRAVGALKDLLAPARRAPRRTSARTSGRTSERTSGPTSLGDADLDQVGISYEPCLDGDPDPGEVVWTWVAYEDDPTQGKDRPVVVIGRDGALVAAVALTSKRGRRGDTVEVGRGRWDTEGRASYAKLDRILRVAPAAMRREGAVLDRDRFERLTNALRRHHGVTAARPR